jgi:FkbM family methyltransferase
VKDPAHALYAALLRRTRAADPDVRTITARAVRGGLRRAVPLLQRRHGIRFPRRATGGWRWTWQFRFEVLMRWHEHGSVLWVRRLVRPGMAALDLGANLGYYSRLLGDLVGPTGAVYAFEPDPENLEVLRHNLRATRYAHVRVAPYAATDRAGTATLHISPGHSAHSLFAGFTETHGTVEVRTIALDPYLAEQGVDRLDFVKMDVEGSEPRALDGLRETIARSPDLVLLGECNPAALACAGTTVPAYLDALARLGFEARAILDDGRLDAVPDESEMRPSVNLLCWRGGREPGRR